MRRRFFVGGCFAASIVAGASPAALAQNVVRMRALYNKDGSFSEYATQNEGKRIVISGFMAPPLKAESTFFVLTKLPMSVCPFCESEADWPRDIVAVYGRDVIRVTPFNVAINVAGILKIGTYKDDELGFVSRVRLVEAEHRRA